MADPAPRDYHMEISTAYGKADVQTLANIAHELATSLSVAAARIQVMAEQEAERRAAARERTRKSRAKQPDVTLRHVTERDGLSPHTPFSNYNNTSSSSSARVDGWRPADEAALASRLPTDTGRNALSAVLARCSDKRSVAAELGMILDGGRPGVSHRPEHMEMALSDYAANGMTDGRFNAAHFRRHVQRASKPESTARAGTYRGGTGNRSYLNAKEALGDD